MILPVDMDVVITYVDINDKFRQDFSKYVKQDLNEKRFRSYGVLDLQIKMIRKYMSYINNIFVIVSDESQVPENLDLNSCKIIYHKDIIPEKYLPCFNSCAIEMFIYRIPGLDEKFIYFNDDIFVINYINEEYFFKDNKPCLQFEIKDYSYNETEIYKTNLFNSTKEISKLLRFEKKFDDKYIKMVHSCRPFLKSTCEKVFNKLNFKLISSLTRTRHSKNFNATIFNDYDYMSLNYVNQYPNYTYIESCGKIDQIIDAVNKKETPIICINDNDDYIDFDEFKENLNKLFIFNLLDKKYERLIIKKNVYNTNTDKIIVTFTSWAKRITYCKKCVENLFKQTIKPDIIYLNLSVKEFPNKELNLPKDLVELSIKEPSFIINWVEGENTKTMKKVFPILKYLNDDDIIINIDDDMLIPPDLIKSRLTDFNNYNRKYAVSSNFRGDWCYCKIPNGEKIWTCACASLMQKKMLNNYDSILTKKIIETYTDDCVYSILAYINGYKFNKCSDYARQTGTEHRIFEEEELQESALRNSNGYKINSEVVEIFEKEFFKKYHIHLNNAFNYFRKKIIVSLTSYPQRTNNPEIIRCLNSLINQTLQPDKIILYLSIEQYPNQLNDIPKYLMDLYNDKKIDIQFRGDDIKSHKKWFYSFLEYSNDLVVTFDDDIIYPEDLIESLYNEWKDNKNCIIASRCHIITYANGKINEYKNFIQYKNLNHGYKLYNENLFITTGGGTLYNVSLFNKESIFNLDLIKKDFMTVDDVYLNKIIKDQNIPILCINKYHDYAIGDTVIQSLNNDGLWVNNLKNTNDIAISKVNFKESKTINICYITDDNYIPLTIFSIETLISKVSNKYLYNIYILHTGNPINFKFSKKNIHIINIKIDIKNIIPKDILDNRKDVIKHVTSTALIKFAIPNIFQNLNKILYIDGDIVIKDDIAKIYNSNINGYYLGVVADDIDFTSYELWDKSFRNMHNTSLYFKIHDKCIKEHGFYFNSGILLFNLKRLKGTNVTRNLLRYKEKNKTTFVDQDTFNLVLGKESKLLSKYYNYYYRYGNLNDENIVVIHVAEKLNVENKLKLMKSLI